MATSLGLLSLAAIVVASLQLCHGAPVNIRDHKLKVFLEKSYGDSLDIDMCFLCKTAVTLIQDYLEENSSVHTLFPVLEPICVYVLNKTEGYNGPYMCPGLVYAYAPVIFDIIAEGALNPTDLCQLLRLCNNSKDSPADLTKLFTSLLKHFWDNEKVSNNDGLVDVPVDSESKGGSQTEVRTSSETPFRSNGDQGEGNTLTFVHLSDIHLDPQYSEGSPSMCNLYLCCRRWYNGTGPAGQYGEYNCDLPLVTLDIVMDTIAQLEPQPDFIIYTGDNSPHDLWNETWISQYQVTEYLISYLAKKLPGKNIYPALGNHETYPESEYIGTLPQYQELTRKTAQYWQTLAPLTQSAIDTITDGAYYTLLIHDKLRLLSFNSDYGFRFNFYTILNHQNLYYSRQESWIIKVLEQAKLAKEKVIIIAHIPPGHDKDTLHDYEEFYLNLTRNYHDIIVGHLFGHTHHDEFKLIQDEGGVYGTVMACPAVTPKSRSNPSFRVFTMDSTTYQLMSYQQYHLNLTLANELARKGEKPKMELAYTTSDLYHLSDLSPASWGDLIERFAQYPHLVSEYNYNKYGRSSSHDLSCDSMCFHETICTVSNIVSAERDKCISMS